MAINQSLALRAVVGDVGAAGATGAAGTAGVAIGGSAHSSTSSSAAAARSNVNKHRGYEEPDTLSAIENEDRMRALLKRRPPQLRAIRLQKQRVVKSVILTLTLAFLLVPLMSMLLFTVRHPLSGKWSMAPWIAIFSGDGSSLGADLHLLWQGVGISLALSAVTVLVTLLLLVPIMVIAHIRSPRLERAIEWMATLPLTIPAIVLVVGLGPIYRWLSADVLNTHPIWLFFAYVILVMPFAFRAIAVGLNSIDVKTLVEASRSLGSSWLQVFFRVLIPNLWQSMLSASFITIAVVLGEFTVASLLGRTNLQVALYQLGQSNAQIATAMSLLALLFGIVLLVVLEMASSSWQRKRSQARKA